MQFKFLATATTAALLLGSVSSPAAPASLFADPVLAQGKAVEVRRTQLDDSFIAFKANLAARNQNIPEEQRIKTEAQLLDRLIISQLLVAKATVADKTVAREKAEKVVGDARKSAGTDEGFSRQLRAMGMTAEQFTNRVVEQAIAEELLTREVRSKITIAPERVQQLYATNDAMFRQPETARAAHILFATRDMSTRLELPDEQKKAKREKADKALARAKKGDDFIKLAEELSEDPAVKENKGEYKFTRAKDDPRRAMVPEFERAAFDLKPGDISSVVTSEFGFHIIKLLELTPARKTPYAEVSDKIRDFLLTQETEKQLPDYFEKLKKDADVKILDEKLAETTAQLIKEAGR